jgi:hypothetical protein
MGAGKSTINGLYTKSLKESLGISFYPGLILRDLRQLKELCHRKGLRCSDTGDMRLVVDSMNRLYRTESNIKHAQSLIRFTNRNTRLSEKDIPRSLRLGMPFFYRLVGDRKKRDEDIHCLEEYTRLRKSILTKKKGYHSVPEAYRSRICSVSEARYDETMAALKNQLKGLMFASSLIEDNSILASDFDLVLCTGKEEDSRARKRHIRLQNRISRRKDRLLALARQDIDDLQLKIGAYSWFKETSRVERFKKKF